jgi:hypothetical protein
MSRFEALMERQAIQTTNTINNLTNNINIGGAGTPETPGEEDGEDGSDDGGDGDGTEPTPPEEVSQSDRITQLENQLAQNQQQFSEFIGENTPEQRSLALTQQLAELEDRERTQGLTDAEKVQWFDLNRQKEAIDSQINQEQQESRRKRERKEKIIKIVAGVAGGAIALASPPVGIAALVGVTLGGRLVGKGLKKWSENLRSKSNAMKYESRRGKTPLELGELDKKIRRRARWADRLGEISAVTLGGSAGYGLGKAVQNIFGWKGIGGGNTPPEGGTAGGNEGGDPTGEGAGGEGGGNTPPDLNTTPEGDIGGPADSFELPDAPTTNFDSLPDKLSFQDYPEMAKGLVQRGMSADRAGGGLLIRGAEGGWANAQGNVVEKMLEMGYDINTPEAGWAIGDLSANRAPLNEQTINSAINAAKQVLGGN